MLRQILLIAKQEGLQELQLSVERDNEASVKVAIFIQTPLI
jgi:predicted acetyltransferase